MLKQIIKTYSAAITALAVFIVYLFTIAPSVIQIDSGELAAVQYNLGIAHPTGYPLFTILGYLFLKIPLPFSKIFQANLFAAICTSMAVWLFIKTARIILKNVTDTIKKNQQIKKKKQVEMVSQTKNVFNENGILFASILGALVLAFSKTFWFQSTSVEVYSLHLLLINLIVYFLMKAYYSLEDEKIEFYKNSWILMAAALALGFTNHMTTLLILPGIAYLFFSKEKLDLHSLKKIGKMLLFFIPILGAIYLYLPLRAASEPILNWGNPIDFERFLRHFTGAQYQVWLFSSFESAGKQFSYFTNNLLSEF
ncbi:MAG: DUF2723 domain-containing protein, partial [Ignavibacteriales bacterium]|nr:DUF2723 domain-containing protein [Ignavibacteriales bacterium]